jgi:hypothetical protein
VNTLWLLPLAIGAAGAMALAVVGRRLAHELEGLHGAIQPLRAGPRYRTTSAPGSPDDQRSL